MQTADLLLVARVSSPRLRQRVERRAAKLERLLAPLGRPRVTIRWWDRLRLASVAVRLDGTELAADGPLGWCPSTSSPSGVPGRLLDASPSQLRSLQSPCAIFDCDGHRARLASSSGLLQILYRARADGIDAWGSHAVGCAVLADDRPALDPFAVAELIACTFVGGELTLLESAQALPPGAVVDLDRDGLRESSSVSPRERWGPVEAPDAAAGVERELLRSVGEALEGGGACLLGLTAGLDSRTLAVALHRLGVDVTAFTFDSDGDGSELATARQVAAALGIAHRHGRHTWWHDDREGLDRVLAEAVWFDGCGETGYGEIAWPADMGVWTTGLGAESGRGFYWRWAGIAPGTPRPQRLVDVLSAHFAPALVGAERDQLRRLRQHWASWVEQACQLGHDSWSALDVAYAEQDVRRWGRSQVPRNGLRFVGGFIDQRLQRLLVSLPSEDRRTDGWERRFISGSTAAPPDAPRVAPSALPSRLARRRTLTLARDLRRRLRLPPVRWRAVEAPWHSDAFWQARPDYIAWLRDDVLEATLLSEALGDSWLREMRAGFIAGDPHAARIAVRAGRAVALQQALAESVAQSPGPIVPTRLSDEPVV